MNHVEQMTWYGVKFGREKEKSFVVVFSTVMIPQLQCLRCLGTWRDNLTDQNRKTDGQISDSFQLVS